MRLPNLLFAAAALGGILTVVGAGVVAVAWFYPHQLIDLKGADVTSEDVVNGFHVQLLGTLIGLLVATSGLAINILCFRALGRDMERMVRDRPGFRRKA